MAMMPLMVSPQDNSPISVRTLAICRMVRARARNAKAEAFLILTVPICDIMDIIFMINPSAITP